jgi:hypothetical protein
MTHEDEAANQPEGDGDMTVTVTTKCLDIVVILWKCFQSKSMVFICFICFYLFTYMYKSTLCLQEIKTLQQKEKGKRNDISSFENLSESLKEN